MSWEHKTSACPLEIALRFLFLIKHGPFWSGENTYSPTPARGDKVTFVPAEFAYIMKILAPLMELPWPKPIQEFVDGPLI